MRHEATVETLAEGFGLVGHDEDGDAVYVSLVVRGRGGRFETTEHEERTHVLELSATFETYPQGRRPGAPGMRGEPSSCGAGLPGALRSIVRPAKGWDSGRIAALLAIADVYHMNTLEAGCAHQTVMWEDSAYGRRPSLTETKPCPHTGYRYGSSWLVREIPAETIGAVVETITNLGHRSSDWMMDAPTIREERLSEFLTGPLVSSAGS